MTDWKPGDEIHGFANGVFGRDSYTCRVVEAVGRDWLVTRNRFGDSEFATIADADGITDPADRGYCPTIVCDPRETSTP